MRVVLYCRVSKKDQKLDLQLNDLRAYAARRGFEILEEYIEQGITGSKTSRPALDRLMADARKKRFHAVLVWRFDRFGRSTRHLLTTLEEFRVLGIQFLSYSENVDTTSPLGNVIFSIFAAFAQFERDVLIERTIAGLAAAKARGVRLGPKQLNRNAEVLGLHALGMTQRAIAFRMGVSKGYIGNVLTKANLKLIEL